MKAIYKIIVVILGILLPNAVCAQTKLSAENVMNKVVNALESANGLTMNMTIQNGTQTVNATLTLAKEQFNYKIGGLTVLFDGKTQWTIDKGVKQVSITEPTPEEIAESNPLAFVRSYKKNYTVSKGGEAGGTYTLKLTARSKKLYVRSAQVVVSTSTWLPTHVTAQLSSGQTLTVRIDSSKVLSQAETPAFKFDQKNYPSFEIIDLR